MDSPPVPFPKIYSQSLCLLHAISCLLLTACKISTLNDKTFYHSVKWHTFVMEWLVCCGSFSFLSCFMRPVNDFKMQRVYLMPTSTKTSEVFTSYRTNVSEQLKHNAPCRYSIDCNVEETSRPRHYNQQFINASLMSS